MALKKKHQLLEHSRNYTLEDSGEHKMHNHKTREKFNTILVSSNYTLHKFQNILENAYFLNNKWLHSL